jgi:glycosyltransferase involved in cell wall biosynthesis
MISNQSSGAFLSVIVPFLNEEATVKELHVRLYSVLKSLDVPSEIIFVDDGSRDATFERMKSLTPLIAVRLYKNYGQTAALAAGIHESKGNIIVTLDGDLENNPADIPLLIAKLEEGYDVVSGWRRDRWRNHMFTRRIPSEFANKLISFATGVYLHDHGCPFRAYRKEILERINFLGDTHRMLTAHAAREGARVIEVPISFEPRKYGESKYGLSRTFKVLLDVVAFRFFYNYSRRPMHFFGAAGFISFFLGVVSFLLMLWFKYFDEKTFIQTPLPVIVALFIILGFQFILMGLLAEMMVRSGSQQNQGRTIKEVVRES